MSTTEQQAAAAESSNTELTAAEKKRLASLPSEIYEAEARYGTAYQYVRGQRNNQDYLNSIPKDSPNYKAYQAAIEESNRQQEKAKALQAEFESLKSRAPPRIAGAGFGRG